MRRLRFEASHLVSAHACLLLASGAVGLLRLCPSFIESCDEVVNLVFSRFSGYPVPFLEHPYELLPSAVNYVEVVIRQLPPPFFYSSFVLLPLPFHLIPIHDWPPLKIECYLGPQVTAPWRTFEYGILPKHAEKIRYHCMGERTPGTAIVARNIIFPGSENRPLTAVFPYLQRTKDIPTWMSVFA